THGPANGIIEIDEKLVLVITDDARGTHTWWADGLPLVSNVNLIRRLKTENSKNSLGISALLDLKPGRTSFMLPVPASGIEVKIAGEKIPASGDAATFAVNPAAFDAKPLKTPLTSALVRKESFDTGGSRPIDRLVPIGKLGFATAGFYFYSTSVRPHPQPMKIKVGIFTNDPVRAYIDGKLLREDNPDSEKLKIYSIPASDSAASLILLYEHSGREHIGSYLNEPKGVREISVLGDSGSSLIGPVSIKQGLDGVNEKWYSRNTPDTGWKRAALNQAGASPGDILWYRTEFKTPAVPGRFVPFGLRINGADYALIYLNGNLIGRFSRANRQSFFYLPDSFLLRTKDTANNITVAAFRSSEKTNLTLTVEPFLEYSTTQSELEILLKK
ncbi:MAG TPA: beta galactosidase jelly roll domain-containing protein, partial [bacterium]|nr:beta galactosidase jelly roll domain-containing protein [bacterium]